MVGDTISDAVEELRQYIKDYPGTYASDAELLDLIQRMDQYRERLDRSDREAVASIIRDRDRASR